MTRAFLGILSLGFLASCWGDDECTAPLSSCNNCPETEVIARMVPASFCGRFSRAEAGTCGDLRYVGLFGAFGSETFYFDTEGALVGAKKSTDTPSYCDDSSNIAYGLVPDCTRMRDVDLCPPAE